MTTMAIRLPTNWTVRRFMKIRLLKLGAARKDKKQRARVDARWRREWKFVIPAGPRLN
jgi:hypothetical protein